MVAGIVKIERPVGMEKELLEFVFRTYRSTNGAYPVLEWVEEKPPPDDFDGFTKVYRPFLHFRLSREFDEFYILAEKESIIGTVGLVYTFKDKEIWWVPEEIKSERAGLVEFFMVDPAFRGRGHGSALLKFAIERLKGLRKEPYIVTFPNLEAYFYYLLKGFVKVMTSENFVVLKYKGQPRGTQTGSQL